mgnify:CR=1 FL=1
MITPSVADSLQSRPTLGQAGAVFFTPDCKTPVKINLLRVLPEKTIGFKIFIGL